MVMVLLGDRRGVLLFVDADRWTTVVPACLFSAVGRVSDNGVMVDFLCAVRRSCA